MKRSEDYYAPFRGCIRLMRLVSSTLGYGPMPLPDQEIEQRLTLNAIGQVWFSNYLYGDGVTHRAHRKERMKISEEDTAHIFDQLADAFSRKPDPGIVTDAGTWDLELVNEEGRSFRFVGSVVDRGDDDPLHIISDELRNALRMTELVAFDGSYMEETT